MTKIRNLLPLWSRLSSYQLNDFNGDLYAGVIVAVMLIPQAMAYAMLAGLPSEVGLYASILPLIIYGLFGSSNFLSVGPVAITSLLVASTIAEVSATGYSGDAIVIGLMLALISGTLLLAMGLARLGFLVNFISHPVIIGFITAAAILIALSQLKHILGLSIPQQVSTLGVLPFAFNNAELINFTTLAIGVSAIVLLLAVNKPLERLLTTAGVSKINANLLCKLGPIVVLVLATALVSIFSLEQERGVAITGAIPAGLPSMDISKLDYTIFKQLLVPALIIALIGFVESISVAKALASKHRQKVDPNQELIALGLANLGASVTNACPVTGGFSRSAVNYSAGAKSGLASIITAAFIAIALIFLTPWFYYLPKAVLAAIIIVAIVSLIDIDGIIETWRYNLADFTSLIITFITVITLGIEAGIVAGVLVSLSLYLLRTSRPHIAIVGRVGQSEHFRNVKHYDVKVQQDTLMIRVDESLYFANSRYLEDKLLAAVAEKTNLKHIVLICSAVNFIDSSALETLHNLIHELRDSGVTFHFAEIKVPVQKQLQRSNLLSELEPGKVFLSSHQAVKELCE